MSAGTDAPVFAFLGPALGGHEGWVTTQGEVLAGLFRADGHRVLVSSTRLNPVARAMEHARDLVRWHRTADVAVVSVFSGRAFALADESLAAARALGLPSVAWLHGGNLPAFGRAHPRWVRRVLRRADAVVAPSTFLARWADNLGLAAPAQVIPNVLDLEAYHHRARRPLRPRLLWMRTFQEIYRPTIALDVLAELQARGIDAHLTMAGQDKGLLDDTRERARELGLDRAVSFPGFASGMAKASLFDDHDLFLNTNAVDNAPVTVLEAAASGLVVVSTDVGGLPDLLTDRTSARFVGVDDAPGMAAAVAELLGDPAAAVRLAEAARVVAERSSWPHVGRSWRALAASITG